MRCLRSGVPILLAALAFASFGFAGVGAANAAESNRLEKIDAFLQGTVPAYDFARTASGNVIDICRGDDACQKMAGIALRGVGGAADEAPEFGKKVATKVQKQSVSEILNYISDEQFPAQVDLWFRSIHKHAPSPQAMAGVSKLQKIGEWAKGFRTATGRALMLLGYAEIIGGGLLETSKHVQAGDNEAATKRAAQTLADTGSHWATLKACGAVTAKAGALGAKVGGAVGIWFAGWGAAPGALIGGILGGAVAGVSCWYAASAAKERFLDPVAEAAADKIYDKGGKYIDGVLDHAKRDMDECVARTDGFAENFCTLAPVAELAQCARDPTECARNALGELSVSPQDIRAFLEQAEPAYNVVQEETRIYIDKCMDIAICKNSLPEDIGLNRETLNWTIEGIPEIGPYAGVVFDAEQMGYQWQAGEYRETYQSLIKLALAFPVNWVIDKAASACAAVTLGACLPASWIAPQLAQHYVTDPVGNAIGGLIYDGFNLLYDTIGTGVVKVAECVGRTDGFSEPSCTLVPITKGAACLAFPAGCEEILAFRAVPSLSLPAPDGDGSMPVKPDVIGGPDPTVGGGIPVVVEPPVAPDFGGDADQIKVRGALDIHVRVDGSVMTSAARGGEAVTRIGSTAPGDNDVRGGRYVTDIEGSVINRGGSLEINPIGGSCEAVRNGRCCERVDRGRCVIDVRKPSSDNDCRKGYKLRKRSGKYYCYKYADRDHRLRLD